MREVKPTQKPVPSSDIKDLFFNSGLLDIWATSLERKYIDRFGNCHLTAAGMEWIFIELVEKFKVDMNTAIVAAGYITVDSFQQGADLPNNELTQRNHILRDETTGEYYRWDGDLPKQVPAGSTPQSTGGVGKGAWVSVGDASLRCDLAKGNGSLVNLGQETLADFYSFQTAHSTPSFNTQNDASTYAGNAKQIRVMGWKEFGDNGSGIFIVDPRQDYDAPDNPDRFKNTVTGKYWLRILNDSMNTYVGLENSAIIRASEKKNLAPWGALAPVNILGDSITYGYFSSYDGGSGNGKSYGGGLFYHTWTSLFARMFAADSGTNCYKGFIPLPLGYGDDWDVFKQVTKVGAWNVVNDGDHAANLYSGSAYQTTEANAELVYAIPATFDEIQIFYCNQPNGGELTISVNGEVWQTLNTASTKVENKVLKRRTVSNPQGSMIISIKKTDAGEKPVGVCGIGVDNVVTFTSSNVRGGAINQFATPGRTLASVSEDVIKDCTKNASALILALGFNDKNISYSGSANIPKRIEFSKRIDWIIKYCNENNTPLIVPDFTWTLEKNYFTRRELRRAATETNGLYIPLPDMLIKGRIATDDEKISRLRMFWDGAHPNRNGQQWIAETIAKYLHLSCSSKKEAILNHDYWMPLDLDVNWRNVNTTQNWNFSAYKLNGGFITVKGSLAKVDNSSFTGTQDVLSGGKIWCYGLNAPIMLGSFTTMRAFEQKHDSVTPDSFAILANNASFTLRKNVSGNGIQGTASFEITKYDA